MELSILIPARNEMFLTRTVKDLLEHIEADTEILIGLDGQWPPGEGIPDHPRVTILHTSVPIGQREMTNQLARLSKAKYLMKVDAHCAFDQGFDRKLLADMKEDWCLVPTMRNLHAFDWVCSEGHRRYQSPSGPCKQCGNPMEMDIVWNPKIRPESHCYSFDSEPHFQYHNEYRKSNRYRRQVKNGLTESMSIQGSCFMVSREKYWDLKLCDESFGSWGSQGIEVACKTWLSGGRVIVSHKTWYAHLFRTQGGDFGFPYEHDNNQDHKKIVRDLFFNNKWEKQTRPLSWLVERFMPITPSGRNRGWTATELEELKKTPLSNGKIS